MLYPPCPRCGADVDVAVVRGLFGKTTELDVASVFEADPSSDVVLEPCGHRADGFAIREDKVIEWR